MSEFFTGITSEKNGIDSRYKWPRYFLKNDIDTLIALLAKDNCCVNLVIDSFRLESGLFSDKDLAKVNKITSWADFERQPDSRSVDADNSITFFDITDFHTAVDLWRGTKNSWRGLQTVADKVEKIVNLGFNDLIIFSDHGCLLTSDEQTHTNFGNIDNRHRIVFEYHSNTGDRKSVDTENFMNMIDIHNIVKNFGRLPLEERFQNLPLDLNADKYMIIKDYSKGLNSFTPDIYRVVNRHIDLVISHKYIINMKTEQKIILTELLKYSDSDKLNEIIQYHIDQKARYDKFKSCLVAMEKLNLIQRISILLPRMKRIFEDYFRKI